MKLILEINRDRQIVIPSDVIETLHLTPGTQCEIEICESPTRHSFDSARFETAMKWADDHRAAFQASIRKDGYATVDDLMANLRPEW